METESNNPESREPNESTDQTDSELDTEEDCVARHMVPFNLDPSLFLQVKPKGARLSKQQRRFQAKSVQDEAERRWTK